MAYSNDLNFLSYSQDKGQTFNFEFLPGMNNTQLFFAPETFSGQAVFDDRWYWFVDTSTTIDFISAILPNSGTLSDTTPSVITLVGSTVLPYEIVSYPTVDYFLVQFAESGRL